MTQAILSGTAATLISVLATYLPGFSTWHAALSETEKKLLWLSILLLCAVGSLAWTCNATAECISLSWKEYAQTFAGSLLAGVGGSQGAYLLLPVPEKVRQAGLVGKMRRGKA